MTGNNALHLGLTPWLAPIGRSAADLVRQAELAEGWGYESFWLPENHFGEGAIPDPLMLLAAVAGATQTIRLATTSFLLPLRHPIQAAEQVAVLDQLSNGRVILGVGRGFQPAMFDAFNVPKGTRVKHPTFGLGSILSSEGSGDQQKVSVVFGDHSVRKFVVKYARLEKLS